ncbi:copper resistance protein CopC [Patescibacteria group bacterium]|nr:copper resistance protein CopC [Patescibacteria group bacterium]
MKHFSKYIFVLSAVAFFSAPFFAFAHASPIFYVPESSAVVESIPETVSIRFSERLDEGASVITVTGPSGKVISNGKAKVSSDDPRLLSVPITGDGEGTYFVSWGVVSSDDGHFTKGAYPFGVGLGTQVVASQSDTQVVLVASASEGAAMTAELFGNGILWALFLIFILAVRPLLNSGSFSSEERLIRKGYAFLLYSAVFLICVGGLSQIAIKAESLAGLHSIGFLDALWMYLQTVAGSATVARLLVGAGVFVFFLFAGKKILSSSKITLYEIGLIGLMCVFAFFRAKISHATANPFFPDFSVAVNFVHLVEKDIWAGAILILLLALSFKQLRSFFSALMPKIFNLLAVNLVFLSVTASYIVWLHLKSFENLFSTEWGGVFLNLLIAGAFLVGARVYHVCARLFAGNFFKRFLPFTLGAELALAILLIFYSSIVIVTSPPISSGNTVLKTASDRGVSITLERPRFDEGALLISASGKSKTEKPTVWLSGSAGTSEPILVQLSKRFEDGYSFPAAFLAGQGPFTLSITIPQAGGYDAVTKFTVSRSDLDVGKGEHAARTLDSFTLSMIIIGGSLVLFGLCVVYVTRKNAEESNVRLLAPTLLAVFGFVVVALGVGGGIQIFSTSGIPNPYKYECVSDGNMWHMMLPTKAGVPTSETPQEGCMWGMGKYQYMFLDRREYDYVKNLGETNAALTGTERLTVGVPTQLTVAVTNEKNEPAELFLDMEKLVHMVIVSRDQKVFAHIHADDDAPLTKEAIESSTFDFNYTSPQAGEYLISLDYAHGITLQSKQFKVMVSGPNVTHEAVGYNSPARIDGYEIFLKTDAPFEGMVSTLRFHITKDGKPVTDAEPYLSAAAHVAIVKNDLSSFIHTHGELHPPGVAYPPVVVKDGKIVHSMASMETPARFGPDIEAHAIFPSAGLYTVWAQFNLGGGVIVAPYTVRID